MSNPWEEIDLSIYEKHMSSNEVFQLQTLNEITKEQLKDNPHKYIGVLGAAGGNGIDKIDAAKAKKVYAVDINSKYLKVCRERFSYLGNKLETLWVDLTEESFVLPYTDLLICNLIIEYIGEEEFVAFINRNRSNIVVVSSVIQRNNDNSFVSQSELVSHFDPIASIHHDIDDNKLKDLLSKNGFRCVVYKKYSLPNGKEFIRMDFRE